MRKVWLTLAAMWVALLAGSPFHVLHVRAEQTPNLTVDAPIPHARGQIVVPVYEGWYRDPAGRLNLSFGYLNRNFEEELFIPIGPDNKIEPGPPDQGQPTHFVPRRQWGAFAVVVPAEVEKKLLAEKKSVTWTLRSRGQAVAITANLGPNYAIDAIQEPTVGNTPPVITFDPSANESGVGPRGIKTSLTGVQSEPVTLTLWVTDDGRGFPQREKPTVTLNWTTYRGRGVAKVTSPKPAIDGTGKATVTATFSEPGEYVLRVEAQDIPIHDFQCCWTNGYIQVTVGPKASR
jgi:hypothetical protein